jgi:NAD(P)-dependent dehydrogenase (short-subunit alcohol dehydrogenase family)
MSGGRLQDRPIERIGERILGALDGRIAIVTGAGRGIGREDALLFAREGASVVVNDRGAATDGSGEDTSPADEVVAEIKDNGGQAVASHDDVADAEGADRLIQLATDTFGGLNILVNNAGILRDRTVVNMIDEEWDAVIRVHLRGHFLPLRAASRYWRKQSKAGVEVKASVINTTSTSGLMSNAGQANYGAAKSGIATLTEIAQKELGRYGVRVNAIAPAASTRLTLAIPGIEERLRAQQARDSAAGFDKRDPGNISPFVAYLATEQCPLAGKVFFVYGGAVHLFQPWTLVDKVETDHRWTIDELHAATQHWADVSFDRSAPVG